MLKTKRLIATAILSVALVLSVAPAVSASPPLVCSGTQAQFNGYYDSNLNGLNAQTCVSTVFNDSDWTNGYGGNPSNISDSLSSVYLYAPAGYTICAYFFEHVQYAGRTMLYRATAGSGTTINQVSLNDVVSSSKLTKFLGNNHAC